LIQNKNNQINRKFIWFKSLIYMVCNAVVSHGLMVAIIHCQCLALNPRWRGSLKLYIFP